MPMISWLGHSLLVLVSSSPMKDLRTRSVFCVLISMVGSSPSFRKTISSVQLHVVFWRWSKSSTCKRDGGKTCNFSASGSASGEPPPLTSRRRPLRLALKRSPARAYVLTWRLAKPARFPRTDTWPIYRYIGFADQPMYLYTFEWPIHIPYVCLFLSLLSHSFSSREKRKAAVSWRIKSNSFCTGPIVRKLHSVTSSCWWVVTRSARLCSCSCILASKTSQSGDYDNRCTGCSSVCTTVWLWTSQYSHGSIPRPQECHKANV